MGNKPVSNSPKGGVPGFVALLSCFRLDPAASGIVCLPGRNRTYIKGLEVPRSIH